jgi:hypothetical protein
MLPGVVDVLRKACKGYRGRWCFPAAVSSLYPNLVSFQKEAQGVLKETLKSDGVGVQSTGWSSMWLVRSSWSISISR